MRHDNFISDHQHAVYRTRGRLPHWFLDHATYHITFRLKDSLPREIALRFFEDHARLVAKARNASERVAIEQSFAMQFDAHLDTGHGSCSLRDNARIVADVLRNCDGIDYTLHAWCVMPNHVHVMLYIERGRDVPKIVHAWKSVSAHRIDQGEIWQREYFDRIVRSELDFEKTREYIHANPTKAGLRNWPWVG